VTPRDRSLQRGVAAVVLLHAVAFLFFPAALWGASHLAAWSRPLGIVWTGLALAMVVLVPQRGRAAKPAGVESAGARAGAIPFPGRAGALLVAIGAGLLFWLLRERTHFFGDGALLIRDRGFSESATRAVLLVRLATGAVAAGARLGLDAATSLAALSVVAGVVGVYGILRLAAALTPDRGGRFLAATLLGTTGSVALFFGHVEYYAPLASAVLLYTWAACRAFETRWGVATAWLVTGLLPALHLGTLALLPAQIDLSVHAWRRGARRPVAIGVLGGAAVSLALVRLAGGSPGSLIGTMLAGVQRYVEPYFATTSSKHAFGLLAPSHFLAFANDLVLVAPMAIAALPVLGMRRRGDADPMHRFLAIAALGCLVFSFFFYRELGPYRDWDILAWCGFVYSAAVGARFVRPHPGRQRVALVLVLAGGLHHLVPWLALQVSPSAALAHVDTVLRAPSQWSPHARGYMHEELAIYKRERGDENGSLHEYEQAVRANPADARYRVGLGTRYVQRGELEAAVAQFDSALALRPEYAPALNNLAYVLARLGRDLERARAHADAALAAEPDNADYLVTRARVHVALGDPARARRDLEAALERRPNFPTARALLAEIDSAGGPDRRPRK